jgi:hypothetical protein
VLQENILNQVKEVFTTILMFREATVSLKISTKWNATSPGCRTISTTTVSPSQQDEMAN